MVRTRLLLYRRWVTSADQHAHTYDCWLDTTAADRQANVARLSRHNRVEAGTARVSSAAFWRASLWLP
jgi:hypothetical protein